MPFRSTVISRRVKDLRLGLGFSLVALATTACVMTVYAPREFPVTMTNYSMGAVDSTGIGEPIFDIRNALMPPTFIATDTFHTGYEELPPILPDMRFKAIGILEDGSLIVTNPMFPDYWALRVDGGGRLHPGLFGRRRPGMYRKDDLAWPDGLLIPGQVVSAEGGFRAELIYAGLSGGTLRAAYREYSDDFIRPAFSQELQYDLAQDSIIGYKTIRVQVLRATNEKLVFRVVEDGDLPWMPYR